MTLKPCQNPLCRSDRSIDLDVMTDSWECSECGMAGPGDDESGEKWNNLLRVEDVEAAFREGAGDTGESGLDPDEVWAVSDTQRDLNRRMGK